MLFKKLTEGDLKIIEILRHSYTDDEDNDFFRGRYVDTQTFLRFWERAKAPLAEAFGDRLIVKKTLNVTIKDDELRDKMQDIFWTPEYQHVRDAIWEMVADCNGEAWNKRTIFDATFDANHFYNLHEVFYYDLFDNDAWSANRYDGPTFEIKLGDGSTMKLVRGCKVMKALGRMAKTCGNHIAEQFETLRLRQSQILNEASINANLCISIHPLDYMTASYNANNWRSCMSWEDGEWRRGVIEMMNSPIVVVAYIESKGNTMSWDNGPEQPRLEWNSKRWREFFIVRPDMISGIKGYPYWNRALEDEAITMLRNMFAPVFGVNYSSTIYHWEVDRNVEDEKWGLCVMPRMACGPAMYNDFYSDNEYHAVFVQGLQNNSKSRHGVDHLPIFYSGESECVVCGNTNVDFYGEREIVCKPCMKHYYCRKCGDPIYHLSDLHEVNGCYYCSHCYEHLEHCDHCGEVIDISNDQSTLQFCISWDEPYNGNRSIDDVLRRVPNESEEDQPYSECELVVKNVCGDCAERVFTTGRAEIDNGWRSPFNEYHYERYYYYPVVPISHLTEYGIKVLGIAKDIEYFKAMHEAE